MRRSSLSIVVMILLLGMNPGGAYAGDETAALLDLVRAARDGRPPLRSLEAEFVQEKSTPLLTEPAVSSGTMRYVDGVSLWRTTKPREMVMRVSAEEVRFYYPSDKVLEIYAIDRADALLGALGPEPDWDALARSYIATRDEQLQGELDPDDWLAIRLSPRDATEDAPRPEVGLLVDRRSGLVREAVTHDSGGGTTRITFRRVRENPRITLDDVRLNVPPDVRVERFGGDAQP